MTWLAWFRPILAVTLAMTGVACGGSSPTAPSLNLSGTWSGTFGQFPNTINGVPLGSTSAWTARWVITQTGSNVSGPMTFSSTDERTLGSITITGTLVGSLTGAQLVLTLTVPSGSVGVFPNCSISGTGSATVGSSTISGTLTDTFSLCQGILSAIGPLSMDQLALTKQ